MKTEMIKIEVELKSICPIKFDRFHQLPQPKDQNGYKEQATEKCYRDERGYLCIPADAIKAVIRETSPELGKRSDRKRNRQTIKSSIFINETLISLGVKKYDGISEDVVTRGMGDKVTRVCTYRPYLKNWKCKLSMTAIGVEPNHIKQCLQLGLMRYGLLSHRPEFGRAEVSSFTFI